MLQATNLQAKTVGAQIKGGEEGSVVHGVGLCALVILRRSIAFKSNTHA